MTTSGSRRAPQVSPVLALAASTTAGYGVLFYAYGVLLGPMQSGLGWSRSFLSGAFSLALVVAALLTIPIGHWLDRHPPRRLFLAGAVAATALVSGWGLAGGRAGFVLVWVGLGACQAVLFYDPAFMVLTKWFKGHARARAITSVTLVAGLASTIFGPLTAVLNRVVGWRGAVLVLAAILAAVTIPAFALGLGSQPRVPGTSTEDGVPTDPGYPTVAETSTAPTTAFRSRAFWLLTFAYVLSAVTTFAVAVHLVSYLQDRGLATGLGATVLGAVGLVQVAGRGLFVRLSARRAALELATAVLAAKAIGLALLLVVHGPVGIALFVVVYGAANGVATLTRAITLAELYGPDHYGSISSVVASVSSLGGALAPFAAAAAIDAVGATAPVFAGLAGLSALAAVSNEAVAWSTRRRAGRRRRSPVRSGLMAAPRGAPPLGE
ncbi:MAG TPA: MFS transporter [Acidimicrobiales bacterium]|nr:MFS transporter [Acidimicrobiales bacterium]